MGKRIGLARMEALLENLKREIDWGTGASHLNKYKAANAAGAGFSGAETLTSTVEKQNNVIITTFLIDLTGLTSDATDTAAIGDEGEAAAQFTQITAAVNGWIYDAEMYCLEAPTGGEIDLDLVADTTATAEGAAATDVVVIASAADWVLGAFKKKAAATVLTANLADYYLHLCVGTSSGPTNGTYTAGKFLIRLYGTPIF